MRALLVAGSSAGESVQTRLSARGWRVTHETSAEAGLAEFRTSPFAFVIVDAGQPGCGAALCEELRGTALGRAAYLLVLTPSQTAEEIEQLVAAGANDYLGVPATDEEVEGRIAFAECHIFTHPAGDAWSTVTGYHRQIAELEETLGIQQASLEELFESAPEGIAVVDNEDRIIRINGEFTRMFGFSAEEALGNLVNDIIVPAGYEEEAMAVTKSVIRGDRTMVETVRKHRDGHTIDVSVLGTPIRVGDGMIGAYGIYRDITERKRSEVALQARAGELERVNAELRKRTAELESAIRARSRLYATMNHELRTPISAIMLYQELLLEGTLGELAGEQVEAVEHSMKATGHLLELVRDVLDLSKIEAGKVSIQAVEVDINELLEDLLSSILPLTRHYGSALDLEVAPDAAGIITDPRRVRQILLNLISNAAKFGRARPIRVRASGTEDGGISIEVADRGIGIGADDLQNIFEDFVQVGNSQDNGTGLGLAISRQLTELLGARLEVESELGVGSTFRLVLPASIAPPLVAGIEERV